MYLLFNTVILLVLFYTFSIAFTLAENESNQNEPKVKDSENWSTKTEQHSNQTNISEISFLPKDDILTFLNIPVSTNGNEIDVLKNAMKSMVAKNKSTSDNTTGTNVESDLKYSENSNLSITTANVLSTTKEVVEKMLPLPGILNTDTTFSILKMSINNGNSSELLKPAIGSTLHNDNLTNESNINANKPSQNSNETLEESSKTLTSTAVKMPSSEVALSELINLSYSYDDGEELAVGQKIDFQRSNMNSDTDDSNTAGKDILKDISGVCGSLLGRRISFANETTLMEYPWTALLLYNTKIRYHCGGSLITKKYVLTAAHCVAQEFYELLGVRLGEHDITTKVDCDLDLAGDKICASTVDAEVVKIIVHHAYSHLSFKNDIALLKLDKEYFQRSFYPICLPSHDIFNDAKQAIVAGWGATEKALRSAVLLKANVPIFDISKCREIYRYSVFNESMEICGSGENEVDVCKGDSGGALFNYHTVRGRDKYFQLGIISLGVRRCGDNRFLPAVFTKLSGFYKWIENNLEY